MARQSERTDDRAVAGGVERIAARLRAVARAGRTVTYNDLAAVVGWDMDDPAAAREVAGILRAISTAEHAAGRPLLSVVVVGRRPGGRARGSSSWRSGSDATTAPLTGPSLLRSYGAYTRIGSEPANARVC